jgi:predicted RNase H-like nuclease
VFPAPPRAVLGAAGYAEACARCRAASGRALPVQAWHLVPRIADIDATLRPADHARVLEVHPELSFRALDPGVTAGKRTAPGAAQRRRAAASIVDDLELPRFVGVRADDVLDALAAAWSARRWATGDAEVLPSADPPRDEHGHPMRIVV